MDAEVTTQLVDWVRDRYFGKYRGVVVDPNDRTHRGRVKVRVPAVLGDLEIWAMPCVPYAGKEIGFYAVPPKGAGVWVEFEAGDASFPIVCGSFWADDERPKSESGARATPPLKMIRTEKGLLVAFDDGSQTLSVSDGNGSNLLKIEVQSGKILIKGATKAVVEAPQIELVENATHPVVFGDSLLQYLATLVTALQTHIHAGELALGFMPVTPAPPSTPFPTPQPSLLSNKVRTG